MKRGGQARWNNETQSWEDGTPPPAPYTGPMPPRPSFTPSVGGATRGGTSAERAAADRAVMDGGATDRIATGGATTGTPTPPSTPPSDTSPTGAPPAEAAARTTYPYPHPGSYPDAFPDPATDPFRTPGAGAGAGYAPGVRRRTGLVAGTAVAVIAAAVGGGYLLWGHGDDPAAARPPARTKASAPAGTATAPPTGATDSTPSTPAPTLTDLPDGYRLAHDKKGFTLAVPGTWTRSERTSGVFYTAPDDRGLVQIFEISDPEVTPREALRKASQGLAGNPGYEEISLEPLGFPGPGIDANQLVYAYDSKRLGMRVKVVDCAFTVADGRQFAVLVLGPETDWPEQEYIQQLALRTFVPRT